MATTKKKAKKKTAKRSPIPCNCVAKCNAALHEKYGAELETAMGMKMDTGDTYVTGPFLKTRWAEGVTKKAKRLPSISCSYCPICGKKRQFKQ